MAERQLARRLLPLCRTEPWIKGTSRGVHEIAGCTRRDRNQLDLCQDERAELVPSTAEHRRKEVDDCGAFVPTDPVVFRLHSRGNQRECGARVAAPGQEIAEEIGEILHALFLHQVHVHHHGPERGAEDGPSTAWRVCGRSPLYPQSFFRLRRLWPGGARDPINESFEDGPNGAPGRIIAHAPGRVGG